MKKNTGKTTRKDILDGVTKDDPEQSRRFVETAKEFSGNPELEQLFNKAINSIKPRLDKQESGHSKEPS